MAAAASGQMAAPAGPARAARTIPLIRPSVAPTQPHRLSRQNATCSRPSRVVPRGKHAFRRFGQHPTPANPNNITICVPTPAMVPNGTIARIRMTVRRASSASWRQLAPNANKSVHFRARRIARPACSATQSTSPESVHVRDVPIAEVSDRDSGKRSSAWLRRSLLDCSR